MTSQTFDKTDLFENQPINKAVWQLATPTILAMLVTVFYNIADTFFIGQTNDPQQVSAISLAIPVFMLCMAVANLFSAGGSSSISRALGAGRIDSVKKISSFCFYGVLASGIILGATMLIFMDDVVRICGANTPETALYVKQYLTYTAFGAPSIILASALGGLTRSEGAAKTAMRGMMLGTIINIILDPIFILYLGMGVSGAAIATLIGNTVVVLYFLIFMCSSKTNLSCNPQDFTLKKIHCIRRFFHWYSRCNFQHFNDTGNIDLQHFHCQLRRRPSSWYEHRHEMQYVNLHGYRRILYGRTTNHRL